MSVAYIILAVTSTMVLAFMVPLGITVQHEARERAMADAQRRASGLAGVLSVTTDRGAVARAIVAADAGQPGRTGVRGLRTGDLGAGHAATDQVTVVARQHQPAEVAVRDGVSYLVPVDLGGKGTPVVDVFVPAGEMSAGAVWWILGGVAAFVVLAAVLIADRLAARTSRSARAIADGALRLGTGDLRHRIKPLAPREMTAAGAALNLMADRMTESIAAERELIADLSHRLRTPLTALRLEAERVGSGPEAEDRLSLAVAAMEREVDHLINIARRSTRPGAPEPDTCDASEVVRERMGFWAAVADDQGRSFAVIGAHRRAPVQLPRSELVASLDALLGNVFRHTAQGSAFEVGVSRRGGYVTVRVDDAGPGIADPDRALRRGSSDRGSTGLGLDIVRRAAIAGHGSVDIGRSGLGGASVVILLADAEPPSPQTRAWLGFVGRLSREPDERRLFRRRRRDS